MEHCRCYLTNKQDVDEVLSWAKKQDFMGRWMPENHELRKVLTKCKKFKSRGFGSRQRAVDLVEEARKRARKKAQ